MKIEIFPSLSGDCLLLTSKDDKRLLADAGLPEAYDNFIAGELARLRQDGKQIDVAYVSHIDRDHIGGVLRLLDDTVKWRVFAHMQSKGKPFRQPEVPQPPDIGEIWHNTFLEDIEKTEKLQIGLMLAASANALASANAATLGDPRTIALAAEIEMLALSPGDAIEVNWRIGADQLDIPLNPAFGGKMMVARPDGPIKLGSLTITVLGPTKSQLEKLRKEWIAWLKKSKAHLEKLRNQHRRDVDDLRSGIAPDDLAALARNMALAVEKDVTPPNLASLVLLVEEDGKRVLLTGDAGDESLIEYLEDAKLFDGNGQLELDVLKVPHHGAFNSYSDEFVKRVRAAHYIFCGDGEHHNPEPGVVKGYLKAIKAKPLSSGADTLFWFNWSKVRASAHLDLWEEVEELFRPGALPPNIKRRSLGRSDTRLTLELV